MTSLNPQSKCVSVFACVCVQRSLCGAPLFTDSQQTQMFIFLSTRKIIGSHLGGKRLSSEENRTSPIIPLLQSLFIASPKTSFSSPTIFLSYTLAASPPVQMGVRLCLQVYFNSWFFFSMHKKNTRHKHCEAIKSMPS